jgi:hypothetical protein
MELQGPFQASQVMSWTIPFENSLWKLGDIQLEHSQPLNVKIISPFHDNRVTISRFFGKLSFRRVINSKSFDVRGKMVAVAEETASYDAD